MGHDLHVVVGPQISQGRWLSSWRIAVAAVSALACSGGNQQILAYYPTSGLFLGTLITAVKGRPFSVDDGPKLLPPRFLSPEHALIQLNNNDARTHRCIS